jgi:hypothetical protein
MDASTSTVTCDWATIFVPWPHDTPISSGRVAWIDDQNRTTNSKLTRRKIVGPGGGYVTVVSQIRETSLDNRKRFTHIEIGGSPLKFFQGNNIYGSPDCFGLIECLIIYVCKRLSIDPQSALKRDIKLSRIDLTSSYQLENTRAVDWWINNALHSVTLPNRGQGSLYKSTLQWGENSKHWSLHFYGKAKEVRKDGSLKNLSQNLIDSIAGILRCEIRLRSKVLERLNLRELSGLEEVDWHSIYDDFFNKLVFGKNVMPNDFMPQKGLSTSVLKTYLLWNDGHDILELGMSRSAFYNHRKAIFDVTGINIAIPKPAGSLGNVIPIVKVLEAKQIDMMDWNEGEYVIFNPNNHKSY